MSTDVRVRLFIRGEVQGVFFRESTRREALRLGVKGWVRNRPEGDVEAVLEGPSEGVEALVRWCHQGPSTARVTGVDRAEERPTGEFAGFDVRR